MKSSCWSIQPHVYALYNERPHLTQTDLIELLNPKRDMQDKILQFLCQYFISHSNYYYQFYLLSGCGNDHFFLSFFKRQIILTLHCFCFSWYQWCRLVILTYRINKQYKQQKKVVSKWNRI